MLLPIVAFLILVNGSRFASATGKGRVRFSDIDDIAHIVDDSRDDHDQPVDAYDEPDAFSDSHVAAMIHRPYAQSTTVRRLKDVLAFWQDTVDDIYEMTIDLDDKMKELADKGNNVARAAYNVIHEGVLKIVDIINKIQALYDGIYESNEGNARDTWSVINTMIRHKSSIKATVLDMNENVGKLARQHRDSEVEEIFSEYFTDVKVFLKYMGKQIKEAMEIAEEDYMSRNPVDSYDNTLKRGKDVVEVSTIPKEESENREENKLDSEVVSEVRHRLRLSPGVHDEHNKEQHKSFKQTGVKDSAVVESTGSGVKDRIRSYEMLLNSQPQHKPASDFTVGS